MEDLTFQLSTTQEELEQSIQRAAQAEVSIRHCGVHWLVIIHIRVIINLYMCLKIVNPCGSLECAIVFSLKSLLCACAIMLSVCTMMAIFFQ